MADRVYGINEIRNAVSDVARRYGVDMVALFGSYAKGEAKPESDIDLRIDKGDIKGLFQLAGFHLDLQEKLKKPVDLVTTESLDEEFLKRIRGEEVVVFER